MPVYGTVAAMKQLLGAQVGDSFDADQEARMTAALAMVSGVIEFKTGAVFGVNTPETILIEPEDGEGSRLRLPRKGIRSISGIVEGPDWSGAAWINGVALATTDYRLTSQVANGAYLTITRVDGAWGVPVAITGVWEDKVPAPVPDDITYLANYLAAETWKKQPMSPAGAVGSDGATVPLRNAWAEPDVKAIIDRWKIGPRVMVG